jgi:TatD DNase family protein
MLIDSHAHLDFPYFQGRLPEVLEKAREAGVEKVVTIGTTPESSRQCLEIAQAFPSVYPTVGFHPHNAKEATPENLAETERLARNPSVRAVGEIGLDFFHMHSPVESQKALFRSMLDIAVGVCLPVVIHDRDAHPEVMEILSQYRSRLAGGVIHCFSGDWDLAKQYLDWGFYLSVPGSVTYVNARDLREVARRAPLDRILLETDAPFLTPAPRRGKKNEPAYIRFTAQEIAHLRQISLEALGKATSDNVRQVFHL